MTDFERLDRAPNQPRISTSLASLATGATTELPAADIYYTAGGELAIPRDTILALAQRVVRDDLAVVLVDINDEPVKRPEPLPMMPGVELDIAGFALKIDGKDLDPPLTYSEFEVLRILLENPGVAITREEFYERVWNDVTGIAAENKPLNVLMCRLRKKLGDPANKLIETAVNVGYRFNPNISDD